tara:strand:+ start:446 stop:3583 length:3138 start_codon:yes stop_codon:yes gene_type:complete
MYKIAHISDTHIRNLKYHDDYRQVFKQLYTKLKKDQPDFIVHCGDLAHTKTQLSPEYFTLASEFLDNLGNIAPLIIILGNHDGNLKNESRQDAVTPIVNALKNPNITLLKNSGEHSPVKGLTFNVLSVFDRSNWLKPSIPSDINIALYHGSISGCLTASGWSMDQGDDTASIFRDHDYAMLGDIHKTQFLDRERKVAYAGSTIQQKFSESPRKGYLLWEIENKENHKVRLVALTNPRPFITVTLESDGSLPEAHVPKNSRLRLISRNSIDVHRLRKACDLARHRWGPHSVTFLNRNESEALTAKQTLSNSVQENLRDTSVQEKHIREYLKDYNLDEEVMGEVLNYNKRYNLKAEEDEEVSRNVVWKIKKLKWDNFFNYGEGNEINFEKLQGLVGIFGRNYSGKSSIIDAALFSLFNATSKSERRNVHVINQNKEKASGLIQIEAGGNVYQICRNLTRYEKNLRGKTTKEAKVELDFTRLTDMESMNGTTRNETDKIIRNKFGSIEDFFMTSMASQMDPLTFIKEGSTKRKEILAKFLDLDFFDKKFKLAKKDAAELRGIVKRMQDRDWASEVRKKSQILEEIRDDIDDQESSCDKINHSLEKNKEELRLIEHSISQIPTEVINISEVKENLRKKRFEIRKLLTNNVSNADTKNNLFEQLQRVGGLLKQIDIDDLTGKKAEWERLSKKRSETSGSLKTVDIKLKNNKKKLKLLDGIPCGDQFPKCKFICDANKAKLSIGGLTDERESLYKDLLKIDKWRNTVSIDIVRNKIVKHSGLLSNKRSYESSIKDLKHLVHKNISKVKLLENEVEALEGKERVYEENREAIENLETLMREQTAVNKLLQKKISKLQKCKKALQELYIEQGSTKQTIETLREKQKELEDIEREWVAYDLFMQCMHPNGIPYNIIKNKLPFLNEEISKILANIVDFEVFFENNDKKLDINIKHPFYDPRPLSMGSGAEKTLASMAIRLALISITNLPKSELFILDEPATALDHDHMEGFVRLLQMIKNQFKTVILISHLDSLKDVVDMAIDIEKIDGFAKVNI